MTSKFRTIEVSDPRFETDHLRFITVKTPNLKGRGDICVFSPPGISTGQPVPVILLLHGVYGSAWSWAYGAGVHLQAMKMIESGEIPPVVIAMPSDGLWGDGSGYLPHNGYDFEKWIAEDVPDVLAQSIPGAGTDAPLFISGLSMGGFGALRIGARYGHRFKGISAHSAITSLSQMKLFVEEDLNHYHQPQPTDEDVFQTFLKFRNQLPPLRFDCGAGDQLIEFNRTLHQQLTGQQVPHTYEEFPGGHEWSYWECHVGRSIRFFADQLKK
ncbi:MAG TPA: alpha/beta hydrolase-fold protein [Anseongella sp.]